MHGDSNYYEDLKETSGVLCDSSVINKIKLSCDLRPVFLSDPNKDSRLLIWGALIQLRKCITYCMERWSRT